MKNRFEAFRGCSVPEQDVNTEAVLERAREEIKKNLIETQDVEMEVNHMYLYAKERVSTAIDIARDLTRWASKYVILEELGEDYIEYEMRQLLVSPFMVINQLLHYAETDDEAKALIERIRRFGTC